ASFGKSFSASSPAILRNCRMVTARTVGPCTSRPASTSSRTSGPYRYTSGSPFSLPSSVKAVSWPLSYQQITTGVPSEKSVPLLTGYLSVVPVHQVSLSQQIVQTIENASLPAKTHADSGMLRLLQARNRPDFSSGPAFSLMRPPAPVRAGTDANGGINSRVKPLGHGLPCQHGLELPFVKASPEAQLRLLELADLDTELGRLSHRRRTLPENAELAQLGERSAKVKDAITIADTNLAD